MFEFTADGWKKKDKKKTQMFSAQKFNTIAPFTYSKWTNSTL
jgi:hypothetical protein